MTKPLLILLILILYGCSNSIKLFTDLPDNCSECKIEITKYNKVDCLDNSSKPISDPIKFIKHLKEINFYEIENPKIGVTNDWDFIITKNDSTILNLGIWLENGYAYINYGGNYYYTICESLETLLE